MCNGVLWLETLVVLADWQTDTKHNRNSSRQYLVSRKNKKQCPSSDPWCQQVPLPTSLGSPRRYSDRYDESITHESLPTTQPKYGTPSSRRQGTWSSSAFFFFASFSRMICSASSVPESALVFEFEASRFEKRWVSPVFHFSFPGWAELSHIGVFLPPSSPYERKGF